MPKMTVDFDRCKGCALCTTVCPKKIVVMQNEKLNKEGFYTSICTDDEKCIACAMCAMICPDCVITISSLKSKNVKNTSEEAENDE